MFDNLHVYWQNPSRFKSCREFIRPTGRILKKFSFVTCIDGYRKRVHKLMKIKRGKSIECTDLLIALSADSITFQSGPTVFFIVIDKLYSYIMIKGWNNLVYFKFLISGIRYICNAFITHSSLLYISLWRSSTFS